MRRITDIKHPEPPPRKKPHVKLPQQPAIEMHTNGLFGRKIKKLPNLLSFNERITHHREKGDQ